MSFCGRGDLLRILAHTQDEQRIARFVGYKAGFRPTAAPSKPAKPGEAPAPSDAPKDEKPEEKIIIKHMDAPFFVPVRFDPVEPEEKEEVEKNRLTLADLLDTRLSLEPPPPTPLLAPWSRLERRAAALLKEPAPSRMLDIQKLIDCMTRAQVLEKIPRKQRKRWPRRLRLVVDRSAHLTPFYHDQDEAVSRLEAAIGTGNVDLFLMDESAKKPRPVRRLRQRGVTFAHNPETPVLALGDCGALTLYDQNARKWLALGEAVREEGGAPKLLSFAPPCRLSAMLTSCWQWRTWQDRRLYPHILDERTLAENALNLLTLTAHANGVEPGLLRELRNLLPANQADAGTEADVWAHPYVVGVFVSGFSVSPEKVKELRDGFAELDDHLRARALRVIEKWRQSKPMEIWFEELLGLSNEKDKKLYRKDRARAQAFFTRYAQTIQHESQKSDGVIFKGLAAHLLRMRERTDYDGATWDRETILGRELHAALEKALEGRRVVKIPVGGAPQDWGDPGERREWRFVQRGETFEVTQKSAAEPPPNASPVASLQSTRPIFDLARAAAPTERLFKPLWAQDVGEDQFGIWAMIHVGEAEQKLRWIAPGEFMMGSPENEEGRYDDEKQHHVTLTRGFWLFDAPVTQALWQAVMGENPSDFKGENLPVENVSWEDCQAFLEKINQSTGLALSLPSEAQWEYACRAGTTGARYHDNIDEIAWYTDNSGSKTHPVGEKHPNAWGLYDMLGNVDEWCQDYREENYPDEPVIDPLGPETGARRVIRGGSWSDYARLVRAACRGWVRPGYRSSSLGFRCSQFPLPEDDADALAGLSGASKVEPVSAEPDGETAARAAAAHTSDKSGERRKRRIQELKPDWAATIGEDRYGLWTNFRLREIEQRLRWIAPGEFLMGSPEGEQGRFPEREKQHRVTLTQGFWLFDTPVTQALWQAVMSKNPSYFQSPTRPVEQVSWDDCRKFIEKINQSSGMVLSLPTEAQWEYACRAGTTTATYAGDLEILGQNNAPILDEIAWYGGNSGVDFELENGYDVSGWSEKQYDHQKAGTHPVAEKQPNAWGLYDMLGNVWEWCQDWLENYPDETMVDPIGPETGAGRVIRGGSWYSFARYVRAAYRYWYEPGYRNYYLGFRCSQFQVQEEGAAALAGLSGASKVEPVSAEPDGETAASAAASTLRKIFRRKKT